jgi:hypothetical protein
MTLDATGNPRIAFTTEALYDYNAKFAYWDGVQ